MPENITVKQFYRDRNIFITGATGFLGIGLVEKLLRDCDVGTIYLLIRPKKGKDINSRLEELKNNLVFEELKNTKGGLQLSKLVAVAGDVGEENLGLSQEDRNTLINNVDVVFHSAATLDFEAGLKPTFSINLLGTRRIVELCLQMRNIKALVHVSSAYVNSNRDTADETIYISPGFKKEIFDICQRPEKEIDEITPKFLGDYPNAYTLTKALAELEVTRCGGKVHSAIVRPSMIVAAWKQPVPGWTISKNGPQGFIMGAAKGVIRRLPVKKDIVYDYIPVDVVINTLILAGWKAASSGYNKTLVFHSTSSTTNPFTWLEVEDKINATLTKYPLKSAVWYPTMKLLPNLTLFRISAVLFHFIPGFFLDLLTRLAGGRPILLRLHNNVNRSLSRLAPFIFREWYFDNSNTMELYNSLLDVDKALFNVDISTLNWVEFFTELVRGVRRYLHNEEMKTLSAAKTKLRILYGLNILVQVGLFAGIWYLASAVSGSSMTSIIWIVPLTYALFSVL